MRDFLIVIVLIIADIYFWLGVYIGLVDHNFGAKVYSFLNIPRIRSEGLLEDGEFLLNIKLTGIISLIGAVAIVVILIMKVFGRFAVSGA
jgi:hypothetical protein